MKANFYLKRPDDSIQGCLKPTAIYLSVSYQSKRIKIPVGESVPTKAWNKTRQIVHYRYTGSVEINRRLIEISEKVLATIRELRQDGLAVTTTSVKRRLSANAKLPLDFWEAFDEFVGLAKNIRAKGTLQVYKSTQHHLANFQEQRGFKIDFQSITPQFYHRVSYLIY